MKILGLAALVIALPLITFSQGIVPQRWYIAKANGDVGFIDASGKEVFVGDFNGLGDSYNSGLVFFIKGKDRGYLDADGDTVFKSEHAWGNFSDRLLLCEKDNNYFYLNTKGEKVLDLKNLQMPKGKEVSAASDFHSGLALIRIHDKGSELFGHNLSYDMVISENSNLYKGNWFFGFIDKAGQWVIPPMLNSATSFNDDISIVELQSGEHAFMDKTGKIVAQTHYIISDYSEGFAVAHLKNGSYSFISKKGKRIGNQEFEAVRPFSDGLAAVKIDGKWGFIDTGGKIAIKPKYDDAGDFSEGLAGVTLREKEEGYDFGSYFTKGLIDKTGAVVIPFEKHVSYWTFRDGLIKGHKFLYNERKRYTGFYELFYMDKDGRKVWSEVLKQ